MNKIFNIISKDENPKILLGDFNLKNNKEIFNRFVDRLKEINMYRIELNEKTFKASKYKREIDHIFLSNNFILKNKEVIKDIETRGMININTSKIVTSFLEIKNYLNKHPGLYPEEEEQQVLYYLNHLLDERIYFKEG